MLQKIAIIVGAGGQDGTILTELLQARNYGIIAIGRQGVRYIELDNWNEHIDILNKEDILELIKKYTPNELYYLAAYHHSSQDKLPDDRELYIRSREVHVDGYFNFLDAISQYSRATAICYASSCLIYEGTDTEMQDEKTLPAPRSPYAITKLEGMYMGNWFAKKYDISIANAILYNHESEYRSPNFLSMKVILAAIAISQGKQKELILGDISTKIDQGSAWDYVEAMIRLAEQRKKGDYIVSSGEQQTIKELLKIVFGYLELDWKKYVIQNSSIISRSSRGLFGDSTKLHNEINWMRSMSYEDMIVGIIRKFV